MGIASPGKLVAGHGQTNGCVPAEDDGENEEGEGAEEHAPVFQERVPVSCCIVEPDQRKK